MENNHNIDKTFSEASKASDEPATFPGFDKVWNKIEEKLDKKEEKKKTILMWVPYGIAASLMIGVGIFYFLNKKLTVTDPATTVIAENVKAKTNTNISTVDSIVKSNIEKEIAAPPSSAAIKNLAYQHPKTNVSSESVLGENIDYEVIENKSEPQKLQVTKDTLGKKEIEEVIVLGLKKEKASATTASTLISSNEASQLNYKKIIADTAEALAMNTPFDIQNELKEPLVLGYNSYKKKKITPSTSMTAEKSGDRYLASKLQGSVAGLNISSGNPGSGKVNILVRGQSSFNANNNPLYIVDGKVIDVEDFKKIDPKKIVSLSVLKDEKATALYGSRAANGIIMVETKDISKKDKEKLKEILKKADNSSQK